MKRTLISLLCFVAVHVVVAQNSFTGESTESLEAVNIGMEESNFESTPEQKNTDILKSGVSLNTFNVTFEGFTEEAQKAFIYALSLWETNINSSIKINVAAKWEILPESQLGKGKPAMFYRNFKGTPVADVFYPVALAEKILSKEFNTPGDADIICSFNKSKSWYFGTNGNVPVTQYDFVTAVMHEIGHGLGISGFFSNVDGVSQFNNSSNSPAIFDYILFNQGNQRIADKTIFPCPSTELTKQLTSNSVYVAKLTKDELVPVYAPATFVNGISIYHLKSAADGGDFMNAYAYKGESNHQITEQLDYVLAGLGWHEVKNEGINTASNDEIIGKNAINIYPNPFTETLTIDCSNVDSQSALEIKIIDLMGTVVFCESNCDLLFNSNYKVDLSSVQSGIYVACITDNNDKQYTKRIIKQ